MWFKNLQIYRLPARWAMTAEALSEQLARRVLMPCGSQDHESRGWLPPTDSGQLVHAVGGQWLIALGIEQRLLPASVVKEEAIKRAEEIAQTQGYKPGRKQMQELRDQITLEFLPRAFTRRRKVFAWIDPVSGWLGIDAPSQARAEDVLEILRQTLDSFPLSLLRTELSPTAAMADWLAAGEASNGFTIDRDCELKSVTEERAAVRYTHHPLEGDEVRDHISAGKLPTKLALTFDERLSFVLTEKLEIKRLDFLDVIKERVEDAGSDDAKALADAEFALMTGELVSMLQALVEALGGELKTQGES